MATINSTPSDEAVDFIKFVNNSPSPFHAVEEARTRLIAAGYEELKERDSWALKNNGKYYFTRNRSTIVAFAIGGEYKPGNGISMAGAHTDSPCLKVKPISKRGSTGYLQVGVEPYGGGLWHTWFDRDLSIAGRAMVEVGENKFEHKLVKVTRPILRIPTLAIHLDSSVRESFKFNKETHLTPLIATATKALAGDSKNTGEKEKDVKHHPALLNLLVEELGCTTINEIHDFELCLYDTQPSTIGGAYNEFIFSARLDNLMMSYATLTGLINSTKNTSESLQSDPNIRLISLFDNEEIGSTTAHGANSSLLESTLRRICSACSARTGDYESRFEETIHKSFMISADMAHAVHPNYCEKHEENHRPQMHQGVVVKINANQRYATTAATSLILRQAAKKYDVPLQEFVVRNDSPCGSTIGPMISANLGLRTVDVGNPQLSMHSIRETAGTDDVVHAIKLLQGYFEDFAKIDKNIIVD